MSWEIRGFLSRRHADILKGSRRREFHFFFRTQLACVLALATASFLSAARRGEAYARSLQASPGEADLQRGLNALKDGRFAEALEALTSAANEKPDDPRIRNFRGIVFAQMGKLAESEAEYREAIRLDSQFEDAWRNLGFLLWTGRRTGEARQAILQAIRLSPEDSFAHYYLGRLELETQEYPDAFRELKLSRVAWPDDSEFLIQIARGYVTLGQQEEARRTLRRLFVRRLQDSELAQVSSLNITIRDYESAIKLLKSRSKDGKSGDSWAQFDLALSYLLSGNYEQAAQYGRSYLDLQRGVSADAGQASGWSLLGITEARANHYDNAVKALGEAAKLEPENEEHWLNWTRELMEGSRYAEAIAATQEGLHANPKSYALHLRLGAALLAAGHYSEAEGTFRELVDAHDPTPTGYLGLTQVLLREGRAEEAAAVVAAAEQQIGESFLLLYFRGLSLDRAGKHLEAAEAFRAAIRMNPGSSEAHLGLGKLELASGHTNQAIEELQRALQLSPDDMQARRLLSQAYRRKGDTRKASEFAHISSEKPGPAEGDLLQDFLLPSWQMPKSP